MTIAIAVIRFAVLALAALVVSWVLHQASGTGSAGMRLVVALTSTPFPLLGPTLVLVHWKYSLLAIVSVLYGLTAIDTAVMGVVDSGWSWLSFVNVALWALLRGSIVIWPIFVPLVVFLRRKS